MTLSGLSIFKTLHKSRGKVLWIHNNAWFFLVNYSYFDICPRFELFILSRCRVLILHLIAHLDWLASFSFGITCKFALNLDRSLSLTIKKQGHIFQILNFLYYVHIHNTNIDMYIYFFTRYRFTMLNLLSIIK